MKLLPITFRRIIAIKKLNNIMINCFQNHRASVLPDKWRFDLIQDWETLALDFGSFNIDDIANKTLQALGFHIFITKYLKKGSLCFTNVTDLELTAKPAVMDNFSQIVKDFEEEVVKKKNECVAKKKERLTKLRAYIGFSLSPCPESSFLLSSRFVPALVPAFVPTLVLALVSTFVPAPFFLS